MTKNVRKTSALVMLSGGLDSAVALYWAASKNYSIETITFDYFLRSKREREATTRLARNMRVRTKTIDVNFLKEIELSRKEKKNPELVNAPSAYIPSRNLIFYGIATSLAELSGVRYIVGGHNKDDMISFPDSSKRFFRYFNTTTSLGLFTGSHTGRVILPLQRLTKIHVILLGQKLGVPFHLTWSCYESGKHPCMRCEACLLRTRAFKEAGVSDPIVSR